MTARIPLVIAGGQPEQLQAGDALQLKVVTTQTAPPAGSINLEPKADGNIYKQTSAGVETAINYTRGFAFFMSRG